MEQMIQDRETNLIIRRFPDEPSTLSAPVGFHPLRLVFHPGRLCLEITQSDVVLGRHSQAEVRLSLPDISRRHCRFVFEEDHWQVIDLESLNGIQVNGQKLHEAVLCHGDVLGIGSLTFVVTLPHEFHGDNPEQEENMPTAMLKSIAKVLPRPHAPRTEIYRHAS